MQLLYKELKDLSVCLLFESPQKAQVYNSQLRTYDIYGNYFENLSDFWTSCLHQSMDLLIVEDRLLESFGRCLKDHPRIRSRQVAVIISSDEPVAVRRDLFENIRCLGLLNPQGYFEGNLESYLKNLLDYEQLNWEKMNLIKQRERLQHRNSELFESFEKAKQFSDEFIFAKDMMDVIDKKNTGQNGSFLSSLSETLEVLQFVKQYAIFGVNSAGSQIVTYHKKTRKTPEFTQLWEGKGLEDGLSPLSCERVIKYSQELMQGDIVPLRIQGQKKFPELLLILSVEDKGSRLFPWKTLEEQFSLRYLRESSQKEKLYKASSKWSLWELLTYLDECHQHYAQAPKAVISVDFSQLISFGRKTSFLWEKFRKDFEKEALNLLGSKAMIIDDGVERIFVLVERERVSESFMLLEDLMEFFEFWRYFEKESLVIGKKIIPSIRLEGSSAENLLRSRERESEEESFLEETRDFSFEWNRPHA